MDLEELRFFLRSCSFKPGVGYRYVADLDSPLERHVTTSAAPPLRSRDHLVSNRLTVRIQGSHLEIGVQFPVGDKSDTTQARDNYFIYLL